MTLWGLTTSKANKPEKRVRIDYLNIQRLWFLYWLYLLINQTVGGILISKILNRRQHAFPNRLESVFAPSLT